MFGLGWTEILLILFVALLFLGPTRLPQIAKFLGKGIREFRNAIRGLEDEITGESSPPRKASYTVEEKKEKQDNHEIKALSPSDQEKKNV